MSAQQVIELVIAAGGVGGLIKGVASLTRLTVAVETVAAKIDALVTDHDKTKATVADHEKRLDKGGL